MVLPGVVLWIAGRRKVGGLINVLVLASCAAVAYMIMNERLTLLHWAVQPRALVVVTAALCGLAVVWTALIVATYRSVRPTTATIPQRLLGSVVVGVLTLAVLTPLAVGGRYALTQRDLIQTVFAAPASPNDNARSGADGSEQAGGRDTGVDTPAPDQGTSRANRAPADPWNGRTRVNVLLLGGDGGSDRVGIRTDTVILASIDTRTGHTVLFSLPRNLERIPFEAGSVLAKAYPGGIYAGAGDQLEWMLTSIYENVPQAHPGLLKGPHPGAQATKLAVSGALNLPIDYYALVNLKGFEALVDALGGITVNVNERVAIGGEADANLKPWGYIERGPNQHMDGWTALWFARGRYGAADWDRMLRQRCVIKAIVDQANPINFLTRYEKLAAASKQIITTDIPAQVLPNLVDLSLKVKDTGNLTNIAFTNDVIHVANPDYKLIRSMVQNAIKESAKSTSGSKSADSLNDVCAYKGKQSGDAATSEARVTRAQNGT
ncbi:LCP family protein [Actinopolymorpha pittospori]|uniref:LCP family protein required for cell wall assembly n=1 Tax=Actinopolymorpha pittospori TaxID=648752 RepID=A0A927R6K5_9ACTN|nr:LCP family protein required for cell wall assembly [Actinopolymorpha pittospori]